MTVEHWRNRLRTVIYAYTGFVISISSKLIYFDTEMSNIYIMIFLTAKSDFFSARLRVVNGAWNPFTVEPPLILSGHPLLSGQLEDSRNYWV